MVCPTFQRICFSIIVDFRASRAEFFGSHASTYFGTNMSTSSRFEGLELWKKLKPYHVGRMRGGQVSISGDAANRYRLEMILVPWKSHCSFVLSRTLQTRLAGEAHGDWGREANGRGDCGLHRGQRRGRPIHARCEFPILYFMRLVQTGAIILPASGGNALNFHHK